MYARYHVHVTKGALWLYFAENALKQIVDANVSQDSAASLFGSDAHRHFCDRVLANSFAYIESEHATIVECAQTPGHESEQRAAFGRLLHTVQDFYAHSNYVDLWLALRSPRETQATPVPTPVPALANGPEPLATHSTRVYPTEAQRETATLPGQAGSTDFTTGHKVDTLAEPPPTNTLPINALDSAILNHPDLHIGEWVPWRDIIFYVPLLGDLARRVWLPADSHEAMHLDSPERGPRFDYAMETARQRTLAEYRRVVDALHAVGGPVAVERFHSAG